MVSKRTRQCLTYISIKKPNMAMQWVINSDYSLVVTYAALTVMHKKLCQWDVHMDVSCLTPVVNYRKIRDDYSSQIHEHCAQRGHIED